MDVVPDTLKVDVDVMAPLNIALPAIDNAEELPLMAFKFKTWDWKSNQIKFIFLFYCIAALVMLKFVAFPVIVISYILLSGIIYIFNPSKK